MSWQQQSRSHATPAKKSRVAPAQMESVAVAIVGAGQAGLATSWELTKAGHPQAFEVQTYACVHR